MAQENPTPSGTQGASSEAPLSYTWISSRPLLEHWAEHDARKWQNLLTLAAEQAAVPELNAAHRPAVELQAYLESRLSFEDMSKVEDVLFNVQDDFFWIGVLAGFALARTWPASITEMNDWPARARAISGLEEDLSDGQR